MNKESSPNLPLTVNSGSGAAIPAHYTEVSGAERLSPEQSGLIYYWRLLQRRKGQIIVIAFLGGLAGLAFTLAQTPLYRTTATIEVHDPSSTPPDYAASDAYLQTQMKVLQSTSLTERVLEKMKRSGTMPEPFAGRRAAFMKAIGLEKKGASNPVEYFGPELRGSLSVRSMGQTRIIELGAEAAHPQAAANFVNTLATEFSQETLDEAGGNTGAADGNELDRARAELESSEQRLRALEKESRAAAGPASDRLAQVQQELSNVKAERALKQSRYELARKAPADAPPDVLADQSMRETLSRLTALRHQLAELSSKYTDQHPKILQAQEQIAAIQATLQKQRTGMLERARQDAEEAAQRENQLTDEYKAQARQSERNADKAAGHAALLREVERKRQIYQQTVLKAKGSPARPLTRTGATRVVDPAVVPVKPYKPSAPQNIALGLLAGLLAGMVVAVTREQADRAIQQPGETAKYFQLRELGAIPSAGSNSRFPLTGSKRASATATGARMELIPATQRPEFIISNMSAAGFVESIHSVLLSILYTGHGEAARRVLALTSSNPGEGKTTLATNLAMAFAGLNRRVLLIDADIRRPSVHEIFGLENQTGLCDLLEGKIFLDGPGLGIVRESVVKNLFVLPSGRCSDQSAILLFEDQLRELVARFRGEFDMVILDTPPLLQIPDARVMARIADGAILVVRAGRTMRDAVAASSERLAQDGVQLLGVILNDWNRRTSANGYYGSYNGSYLKYQNPPGAQSGQPKVD